MYSKTNYAYVYYSCKLFPKIIVLLIVITFTQ